MTESKQCKGSKLLVTTKAVNSNK